MNRDFQRQARDSSPAVERGQPDAREERFLAKLRAKLKDRPKAPHPGPRPVPGAAAGDVDGLVTRFSQELAAVGGRAERCRTPEQLAARLAAVCREAGVRTIALEADPRWDQPRWQPWRRALDKAGCELLRPGDGPSPREIAAAADAGLTIADFAIADTGTLGQWTGTGRSRVISLLPLVHLVLLPAGSLVATRAVVMGRMEAAAAQQGWPSQVVFITGPSRTGDIEGALTVGVHGPGQVHVFIVDVESGEDGN